MGLSSTALGSSQRRLLNRMLPADLRVQSERSAWSRAMPFHHTPLDRAEPYAGTAKALALQKLVELHHRQPVPETHWHH